MLQSQHCCARPRPDTKPTKHLKFWVSVQALGLRRHPCPVSPPALQPAAAAAGARTGRLCDVATHAAEPCAPMQHASPDSRGAAGRFRSSSRSAHAQDHTSLASAPALIAMLPHPEPVIHCEVPHADPHAAGRGLSYPCKHAPRMQLSRWLCPLTCEAADMNTPVAAHTTSAQADQTGKGRRYCHCCCPAHKTNRSPCTLNKRRTQHQPHTHDTQ